MTCVCSAPLVGDPATSSCVSPPGTISIVPNPVLVGSFLKPFSGNGSVYLINVGSTPVEYQIYGVETYCEKAKQNQTLLSGNNTNYGSLCSNVNETAGVSLTWEGVNGTVVLCSFNTVNFTVSSEGLAKGDYETHLVVDSDSETGAESMTLSFSVAVTASQVHSTFDTYYFGAENNTGVDVNGKVDASSDLSVRNDEVVFILVEPRDMDGLAIFQSDDSMTVSVVDGSDCVEVRSSIAYVT
jgi:hypothetical protein